jgi:hypothetical protein
MSVVRVFAFPPASPLRQLARSKQKSFFFPHDEKNDFFLSLFVSLTTRSQPQRLLRVRW